MLVFAGLPHLQTESCGSLWLWLWRSGNAHCLVHTFLYRLYHLAKTSEEGRTTCIMGTGCGWSRYYSHLPSQPCRWWHVASSRSSAEGISSTTCACHTVAWSPGQTIGWGMFQGPCHHSATSYKTYKIIQTFAGPRDDQGNSWGYGRWYFGKL